MQLVIDTLRGLLSAQDGTPLEFDRYHPLSDDADHRFIVRRLASDCLLIEIKKGKQVVQSGKVRHLSATVGTTVGGRPALQSYTINLDPSQAIYPIAELVDRVLKTGLKDWEISPMFETRLSDCLSCHPSLHMVSDGEVTRIEHPSVGGLKRRSQFIVEGGTWAVRFSGTDIGHIYLWMGAAEHADTILDVLKGIKAGEVAPTYSV